MSNLIEFKNRLLSHKKVIEIIIFTLALPFCLTIINMFLSTLFNLGVYSGTFLRFLYDVVVY